MGRSSRGVEYPGERPHPADDRSRSSDRGCRERRPDADHGARNRWTTADRRVPADSADRQHHGRAAQYLRLGGHPGRTRSRHRGKAGGPGHRQGGRWHVAAAACAMAQGDLRKKVWVAVSGEVLQIKDVVNTVLDQLSAFASEVTRVAGEVGTDGRLGGQADVKGVAGTWKDLTDSVNFMASNLTSQVRNIAEVTKAVATGDLSKKITVDVKGEILELKNTINTMVDQLCSFAAECE